MDFFCFLMILGKIEIDGLKKNEGGRGGIWAASGQLCALHPQFFAQIIMAILHFNLTWQIIHQKSKSSTMTTSKSLFDLKFLSSIPKILCEFWSNYHKIQKLP